MRVEVVYALPEMQHCRELELPAGSRLRHALEASGLLAGLADVGRLRFGVWGRVAGPDTPLQDRDRVEIYRPLVADPKELRRKRAAARRAQP